ncbi:unnamed protein product [Sphagnum tenellum]
MNHISKAVDDSLGKKPVGHRKPKPDTSSTEKMKAVTWQGKRKMEVSVVPKPMITHAEDAIIKVTACSVCSGSDGHIYAGEIPTMDKGYIVGHECMGVIESKGAAVNNFKEGDRVVVAFDIACGKCSQCQKQQFTGCEQTNNSKLADQFYGHAPAGLFGYSRLMGDHDGSQAEYVRVPFADTNCLKVPDDVPDEKALYLSDVLCTALHATVMGEVSEGDTVGIWGLGPIGLCTALWCKLKGAKRIVGIDLVPERLALAKSVAGIEVVDRTGLSSQQLVDKLTEIEPLGFDTAIEAVGFRFPMSTKHKIARAAGLETDTPELIDECLTCIKQYGRVSIIGDYAGYANMFPVGKIMFKHCTVRSGQAPVQRYWSYVLEKIQDGTIDPTFMITHKLDSLDDIPLAYEKLDKKEDGYIKIFVRP